MKKYLVTAAAILAVGLVAGCGSSSQTAVSGKVADGYLVNATVFMDKNGNYQLDPGEPFTTTDATGAYTLNVDPADVGKYPIVAMAVQGVTVDMDKPNEKVAASYLLSMPANSITGTVNSNFISPISSQLREMMETGKYDNVTQAMDDLRTKLGLPAGTNVLEDYMAANHVGMHTAAQKIAGVIAGQMTQVMPTGTAGVQVERYRGMMGAIFSNMSSIKSTSPRVDTAQIVSTITTMLENMPAATSGHTYRNMSAAFRAGMRGGSNGAGMMH